MRFGIFGAAQAGSPGAPMGQGFHDFIDFNVEAEALGYHGTFLVEHHFTGWNQVSATLTLLTWLAARTTTLRLGTAVMVLPWHNPVILAEQAATLDLLSDGRLDFGVGKGYRYNEFTGFAIPLAEADARFEEALAIITKAWTSQQRFSHHGRFWTFDDILVEPPTSQKPHPPFWMAAGSPASIRRVAERGYNLLLDQFAAFDMIGERIALFNSVGVALAGPYRRIPYPGLWPRARGSGGEQPDRHAGRDHGQARRLAPGRRRIRDHELRRLVRELAPLRARDHAGLLR